MLFFPLCVMIWAGLSLHRLHTCYRNCHVFIWQLPNCVQKVLFPGSHDCLWVSQSFCTLFSTNSRVWEKGCDIDVLIMSESSTVACSLHFGPWLVSVLASIYCQMRCLWWGLGDSPIYEYNKNSLWVGPWIYNSSKAMLVHIILHNMPIAFDKAGLIFFSSLVNFPLFYVWSLLFSFCFFTFHTTHCPRTHAL